MTAQSDEVEKLREAMSRRPGRVALDASCPPPDQIWAAARGELARAPMLELLEHSLACSACGEDWRLARTMAAEAVAGAREGLAHRGWNGRWLAVATAAAGLALVAVLLQTRRELPPIPGTELRSEEQVEIRSLQDPSQTLPRGDCLLRWEGPEGAVFDIQITTDDLKPVASARGLRSPEYRVPAAAMVALQSRARLLWQVDASLPDGRTISSRTFAATLE